MNRENDSSQIAGREIRFEIAKPDIISFFEGLSRKIFSRSDIEKILSNNQEFWRLSKSMSAKRFIQLMLERTDLQEVRLEFPYRIFIKYIWGDASDYEILCSIDLRSYFTHYTAIYLHELTEQIPKTVYLNIEQPPKRSKRDLDQGRIDMAFRRPARVSKNVMRFKEKKVYLLNGMYTGALGVIQMEGSDESTIPVTDIERTLIDIAVRPVYSGGVFEVLNTYEKAKGRCSVNKLAATLKKIDFIYPYHQVIGFYLERAGYKESSIRLLRKFNMKYNFYLTHGMKEMSYSEEWRLYFPKGF